MKHLYSSRVIAMSGDIQLRTSDAEGDDPTQLRCFNIVPVIILLDRLSCLLCFSWYHPDITRHIAETLLLKNGEEGAFLLRDKTTGLRGREFVLSVRYAVSHSFKISHF